MEFKFDKVMLLSPNSYSRPGTKLDVVRALVIHWVANPRTTPEQNINFFEMRKKGQLGYGSAHVVIGIDGRIVQCVPFSEVTYNCGSKTYTDLKNKLIGPHNPNSFTIGIELCHLDWEGSFSDETLDSAKKLCVHLCQEYKLNPLEQIVTHKDIVGWKQCPKFFCNFPMEFEKFKRDINSTIRNMA